MSELSYSAQANKVMGLKEGHSITQERQGCIWRCDNMKWVVMICYSGIILALIIGLRRKMGNHGKPAKDLKSFEDKFDELFVK